MALLSSCQVTYTAHNCTWLFFGSFQYDLEEYKTPFSTKTRQSSFSCKESLSLSVKYKTLKWAIIVRKRRENAVRSQQWNHRKFYPKKVEMEFFIPKIYVKYLSFFFHRKFQTVMRFPSTLTVLKIPTNWLIYYSFSCENFEHLIYLHTKGLEEE